MSKSKPDTRVVGEPHRGSPNSGAIRTLRDAAADAVDAECATVGASGAYNAILGAKVQSIAWDVATPESKNDAMRDARNDELADAKWEPITAPGSSTSDPKAKKKPDAYRQALGLLVRREHSRRELKRKLGAKGTDADAADAALEKLNGQGYQDDARFAEMLVRTRVGGGYGPLHIRAELGTHAIPSDTIASVLADAEPDWPALARDTLQRRFGTRACANRKEQIKRSNFLQRRGFDGDSIRLARRDTPDD